MLTAALYHPAFARFRRLTRWALIALTAATIVAYFALIQGQYDAIGIGDKIAEVVLIVLLVVEGRRDRLPAKVAASERPDRGTSASSAHGDPSQTLHRGVREVSDERVAPVGVADEGHLTGSTPLIGMVGRPQTACPSAGCVATGTAWSTTSARCSCT